MNRRHFSKSLVLGAGSLGLAFPSVAADPPAKGNEDASAEFGVGTTALEPVTVAEFQAIARQKLPPATYGYITSGSTDQLTLRENVLAFQRIKLLPPILRGIGDVDPSTTVLQQRISMPIMLAPVAAQRMYHPHGAAASARAAAKAGTILGVSSSAGNSVEEIAAASDGLKWFQLYPPKDRAVARQLVERAEKAGYRAIVVTVDLGERKDSDLRHRFVVPRDMLLKHLCDVGFDVNERMSHDELITFNRNAWDMSLSWEFFEWLRPLTRLPILLKGVLRADDAKRAADLGLDGIVVSNHGGRRLDGMPATIDCLPAIVEAVGGRTEILLDSGVRRGNDVLKALALGAKAVFIGRPYAWALAADGENGVSKVLSLLREEFTVAMHACGCGKVSDIDRSLVVK